MNTDKPKARIRDAAVATGALAAGGGIAYAGHRIGKAARNARVITAGVVKTGRKIERASRFIKRTISKIPGLKLESRLVATVEFSDSKRPMNPAIKAGLSAAASGAALGLIPAFRRGAKIGKVLKSVGAGAATGAVLGGGGTAIGTKILGKPRKDEGAPITKRAAIGGAIGGAVLGGAGVLAARKFRAPARALVRASKEWSPALLIRKAPLPAAVAVGTGVGAVAGAAHASDEGQQVDTLNNLRKDKMKKVFSGSVLSVQMARRLQATFFAADPKRSSLTHDVAVGGIEGAGGVLATDKLIQKFAPHGSGIGRKLAIGAGVGAVATGLIGAGLSRLAKQRQPQKQTAFSTDEAGIPFTGKVAKDRYIKKIRDADLDRRDANLLRAGVAGAAVGLLTRGKLSAVKRAAIGATAGGAAVAGVRKMTAGSRDPYGERPRGAKRAESLPAIVGTGTAAVLGAKRLKSILPHRLAATIALIEFDIHARNAKTGRSAGFYDYVKGERVVDGAGNSVPVTLPTFVSSAHREARKYARIYGRGSRLAADVADVSAGRSSTRKREWEKQWFRNAATTGVATAGVLAHGAIYRRGGMKKAPEVTKKYRRAADRVAGNIGHVKEQITRSIGRALLEADGRPVLLSRLSATLEFDAFAEHSGWDVRDPRGRSARVFAPGSRKRMRRPADWHETKDGQRKILGTLAAAGTVAGVVGGIAIGKGLKRPPRKGSGIWRGYEKSKVVSFPSQSAG